MDKPVRDQFPDDTSFWAAYRMWQCRKAVRGR